MYQWKENEERTGSGNNRERHYSYSLQWVSSLEPSERFRQPEGHKNPDHWRTPPKILSVPSATLGDWQISSPVLHRIDAKEHWIPAQQELKALPPPLAKSAHLTGDYLYFAQDPSAPEVGDERVRFNIVPIGPISVIARQTGNGLSEYHTSNGRELVLAEAGVVGAETMFQHALTHNRVLTWILRGAGVFLMFFGIRLMIQPVTSLLDWIPFVGGIIDSGATLASLLVALGGSAITIAVAWFAVRPLFSGTLAIGAVGSFWMLRKKRA
jgi:hypothetical protein